MMNLRKLFGTSKEKAERGVWVDGPAGSRLLIARFGNSECVKLTKQLMRPHRASQRAGQLADEILTGVAIKVLANTVLLGWEKLRDGEGDKPPEIPYSPEAAERLLKAYPDFRALVSELSNDIALFLEEEEKAAVKN